jgi:hypothetical protein
VVGNECDNNVCHIFFVSIKVAVVSVDNCDIEDKEVGEEAILLVLVDVVSGCGDEGCGAMNEDVSVVSVVVIIAFGFGFGFG